MAETKTFGVDNFKAALGAGQRSNMYKIDLLFPTIIPNTEAEKIFSIMCESGSLPGERAVSPISIPYEGDYVQIAGDKGAPEAIPFIFKNSEVNIFVRKQFRLWSQLIQTYRTGVKSVPGVYKTDQFFVSLLNYKKEVIEKVQLIGAFPTTVNTIAVTMANGDITNTEISFTMDDYKLIL